MKMRVTGRAACLLWTALGALSQSSLPPPMLVVAGAPYSGEQVQERVETLSDGSRVARTASTAKMYRDSRGRTRTEREESIEIDDPVAAVRYTLNPRTKVAQRVSVPRSMIIAADAPSAVVIIPDDAGIRFTPPEPGVPVAAILTTTSSDRPGAGKPRITTEDLGNLTIDGGLVEGSRQTITIPGDDGPVVTVSDTWTSPDLKIVMMSKMTDPRTGETSVKMAHLSRSEPVPDLFQPPPDYRIVENTATP